MCDGGRYDAGLGYDGVHELYTDQRLFYVIYWVVFFFQAEDGIRDLVRSRGLGDVYKRQDPLNPEITYGGNYMGMLQRLDHKTGETRLINVWPVSYTHLTLPTSDLV